jgi:predicted dienelactone hydrolase
MRRRLAGFLIVTLVATPLGGCSGEEIDAAELSESGGYGVGWTTLETVDTSRDARPLRVSVFYPALTEAERVEPDAEADTTGAPYPVILGDGDIGDVMGPHLASHGFVFAAVQGQHTWGMSLSTDMIDFPLDHMATLDEIETLAAGPLAGMADTSKAGTIGYSFGGWDALMLTGARIDPEHYREACVSQSASWSDNWWDYVCGSPDRWDRVVERAEEVGIATPQGLWDPMGDDRIKAAMPMGAEGYDMTGPDGLAGATAPVLLIGASDDTTNDYDPATTSLFEHYPDADLITFVGADHFMIFEEDAVAQMRRFAVAFFAYHLTGDDAYQTFLTEGFVEGEAAALEETESYESFVWGMVDD